MRGGVMGRWITRMRQVEATTRRATASPDTTDKKTPPQEGRYDPLAPLDGEGPSVWRLVKLRACSAYHYTTWCASNPRHPERCVHCRRALAPEEQGNPYEQRERRERREREEPSK